VLTSLDAGLLRSAFAGQANAILVRPPHRIVDHDVLLLNSRRFRRAQARWLGLGTLARIAWANERRVCQGVRIRLADGTTALITNLHATSYPPDERLADAELLRAATFAEALAAPDEPIVMGGDFNVTAARSWTLGELAGPEWGFSKPGTGIDQIIVRGARASAPHRWAADRRRMGGRLLSDHAPVELRVG
jgi:endonuclease/exonuclease/phosphatase family metal-dependent hydrolase